MSKKDSKETAYIKDPNSYDPKTRSSERWKKSPAEKQALKALRSGLFYQLHSRGFDPKKRMNITSPVTGIIW